MLFQVIGSVSENCLEKFSIRSSAPRSTQFAKFQAKINIALEGCIDIRPHYLLGNGVRIVLGRTFTTGSLLISTCSIYRRRPLGNSNFRRCLSAHVCKNKQQKLERLVADSSTLESDWEPAVETISRNIVESVSLWREIAQVGC